MRSSACSASRRPTRTIPNARSARRFGSARTPSGCRASAATPLRLRVGINTGEALVRLGVVPGSGERFLAGDAINTASRIQSVAPEMGVAVGQATYEATRAVVRLRGAGARDAQGQGRAGPGLPRRARGPGSASTSPGPTTPRSSAARSTSRSCKGLFDKTVAASSVQLVTVVGEPGIGKSRIVAELARLRPGAGPTSDLAPGPLPAVRRRGHVLGAGRDRQGAGRDPGVRRLRRSPRPRSTTSCRPGPDRDWLRQRLRPLLGVGATSLDRRARGAVRRLADVPRGSPRQRPTVLVFEDIHWADDAMLAFLEHLADRAEGVPLLLVATARPELFERHARLRRGPAQRQPDQPRAAQRRGDRAARRRRSWRRVLPPELQRPILERAEGNPLYAEEFVRLLRDRDLLVEADGAVSLRPGAEVPLPESIEALIAARLDTLPPSARRCSPTPPSSARSSGPERSPRWASAIAEVVPARCASWRARSSSDRPATRRWPARPSTPSGTSSPATSPTASCPRASRAARHVAAAKWLEAKAGTGPRTSPRSSPTTTPRRSSSPEPPDRPSGRELEAPALRFLGLAARARTRAGHGGRTRELRARARARPRRASRPGRHPRPVRRGRVPHRALHRRRRGAGGGDRVLPGAR